MAIVAGVNRQMPVMVETRVIRKQYFFNSMAFTTLLDTKSGFAVMARAARHSFIHFSHAVTS